MVARARHGDDGVALVLSLLVIILASSLSLAVAGSILAQAKPTMLSRKLAMTVSAAEAGIDVAQKRVRAGELAVPSLLPCGFNGNVDGTATYTVTMRYYRQDPTNKTRGWLNALGQQVACPAGGLSPSSPAFTTGRWYALIESDGKAPAVPGAAATSANRTMTAIMQGIATPVAPLPVAPLPVAPLPVAPLPVAPLPVAPPPPPPPGGTPPVGFVALTSGDGWEALFFDDNVYNVFHHYADGGPGRMIDCHSKTTGASCVGYAGGGTYASSVPGPFGTGPDDLITAFYNMSAVDRSTGRVYIAAGRAGTTAIGVQCLDLRASQSCGFTRLANANVVNGDGGPGSAQIAGGAQIGTKFYVASNQARIYCFDYSTASPCSSFPSAGVSMTTHSADPYGYWRYLNAYFSSLRAFDGRYIFGTLSNSSDTRTKDLTCLDTKTNASCSGFPKKNLTAVRDVNGKNVYNASLAPILSSSGVLKGICASAATSHTSAKYACFNLSGDDVTQPWPVQDGEAGYLATDGVLLLGKKMYLAASSDPGGSSSTGRAATYRCWDFAKSAWCSGFTPSSSNRAVAPYTLRQDPYRLTCIWEVGDSGVFEFFHRDTGKIGAC